jgi:hypothetical protein
MDCTASGLVDTPERWMLHIARSLNVHSVCFSINSYAKYKNCAQIILHYKVSQGIYYHNLCMHTRARSQQNTHKHKADVLNLPAIFKTPANFWQFQLHGHIKKNFKIPTYFNNSRSKSSRIHFQQYLRRQDIVENYRPSVTVPEIYGHFQQWLAT